MQCPIVEPLPPSQVNQRRPQELHWRRHHEKKDAPRTPWRGCVERAYQNLYPHLVDDPCCLQCGAVPCPYDHNERDRLRLQDLDFVRELARERKTLTQQLEEMAKAMQGMVDRENEWKLEKDALRQQARDYEMRQREWQREKTLMEAELNRLQALNDKHQTQLTNYRRDQQKMQVLQARLDVVQKENERLQEENEKFRKMIVNQQTEIQNLNTRSQSLDAELQQSQAQSRMLRVQLDESNEDLKKVRQELSQHEARMRRLKQQVADLLNQMDMKDKAHEVREMEVKEMLEQMKLRLAELTAQLDGTNEANEHLRRQVAEQQREIERLRAKLASDTRFRKFVDIKREVNDLREENQTLFQRVADHEKCQHHIPVMKRSGRVTVTGSNVVPPTANLVRQIAPGSASGTKLQRPKSCRTLRSLEYTDEEWEEET